MPAKGSNQARNGELSTDGADDADEEEIEKRKTGGAATLSHWGGSYVRSDGGAEPGTFRLSEDEGAQIMESRVVKTVLYITLSATWALPIGAMSLEPVPVQTDSQNDWVRLQSFEDSGHGPSAVTHAAAEIWRIVDPDTGEPYVTGWPFDCAQGDIHRMFRLEKRDFLLGEPILVEYRVTLDGPGTYAEGMGSNYRSRGRDDNFMFLLRREDGTWLRDAQPFAGGGGGGAGGPATITDGKPSSNWAAVQRWVAIEEPGRYDLYCFYVVPGMQRIGEDEAFKDQIPAGIWLGHYIDAFGRLCKAGTNDKSDQYVIERTWGEGKRVPSPLLRDMPDEVTALLSEFTVPTPSGRDPEWIQREVRQHIEFAGAFAHFPIVITGGSPEQTAAMVNHWTKRGNDALRAGRFATGDSQAVLDGIYFTLQPYFLDTISQWVVVDNEHLLRGALYRGLGFNTDPKATAILLGLDKIDSLEYVLRPDGNPATMGNLISVLTNGDAVVRQRALELLRSYSGCYFFTALDGSPLQVLSDEQMKEAHALWTVWWARNAATYRPTVGGGFYGYIDRSGVFVIAPQYVHASSFHDGLAAARLDMNEDGYFHIDRNGERLNRPYSRWGIAPIRPVQVGELWGYETRERVMVIPAQYERAGGFSDGLAQVRKDGKCGYINTEGTFVIPLRFDHGQPFENGKAIVIENGRSGIIDPTGAYLLKTKYSSLGKIAENRIKFRVGQKSGYMDESGVVVIDPEYQRADDFKEGRARVQNYEEIRDPDGPERNIPRTGFIDPDGQVVVPLVYTDALDFADGLAAVNAGDDQIPLWGYIDRTGTMVIPPQFADAQSFSEGRAGVRVPGEEDNTWGFIDKSGAMVVRPQFVQVSPFSEGLSSVVVESPYQALNPDEYRSSAAAP